MTRLTRLTDTHVLAGLAALAFVNACASAPTETTYAVIPAAALPEPVEVPVPLDMNETEGTQYNQWGGIVPDAKPTTPVDDGALGEIN